MSRSKATGPMPSQILDPPKSKDADAVEEDDPEAGAEDGEEPKEKDPDAGPDDKDDEDPLDQQLEPVSPARGSVPQFNPPKGPFQPFRPGAGQPPSLPVSGLMSSVLRTPAPQPQPPLPAASMAHQDPPPGNTAYVSDEKMLRNLLRDQPDELLVNIKVHRVEPGKPAAEVGTIEFVPASEARDASNFIDVAGRWIVDYRRSSDGKPLSKSKVFITEGPDYYPGWRPRLLKGEGEMDPKLIGLTVGEVMKNLGIQLPVLAQGQPGVVGVPTNIHNADVLRLQEDVRELKQERSNLLTKLESKDSEIRSLERKNVELSMQLAVEKGRPQTPPSDGMEKIVALAKIFSDSGKKDNDAGMWTTLLGMQQDYSRQMMELMSKRGGDAQMDRINSAWSTLFDGATKMATAAKPDGAADIAKALAPLGVQWLAGQQQMQMKAMELKAQQSRQQPTQQAAQPQTQQQVPAPAQAEQPKPPDPNKARIEEKAKVFNATMGLVLSRAMDPAIPARTIGTELAVAVYTALGQQLAEGDKHNQHMIKTLIEDPEASIRELAKATGKDESYTQEVVTRFKERFKELLAAEQPKPAAEPPAVAPPSAAGGPADPQKAPESGNGKGQGAEPGPVAKSDGGTNHGNGDGSREATGSVDPADHPDVASQPS